MNDRFHAFFTDLLENNRFEMIIEWRGEKFELPEYMRDVPFTWREAEYPSSSDELI